MGSTQSLITSEFEKRFPNLRVIFAVDVGSRTFGWASKGSDYDVHIVYVHRNFDFYYSLNRDLKERIDLDGKFFTPEGIEVNIVGYELGHFFRFFAKSNTCVAKFFLSPSQFFFSGYEKMFDKTYIQKIFLENYNPKAIAMSYIHLVKENFRKHVCKRKEVRVKSYIYLIHHTLFLRHIMKRYDHFNSKKSYPEIVFDKLYDDLECHPYIRNEINTLINLKRNFDQSKDSNKSKEEEEEEEEGEDNDDDLEKKKKMSSSVQLVTKRRKCLELWFLISRKIVFNFIRKQRGISMDKKISEKLFLECLLIAHPNLRNL